MSFKLLIESWQDGASGIRFSRRLTQTGQKMSVVKYRVGNCRRWYQHPDLVHGSEVEPTDRDWLLAIAANASTLEIPSRHTTCMKRHIDLSDRPGEEGWFLEGWSEWREHFHMAATWHTWVLRYRGKAVAWFGGSYHIADDAALAAAEARTAIHLMMDRVQA